LHGTEDSSYTTGSSVLDALSLPTQVASPVRGGHYIGLRLDHASLHLTENGFAFFQAQTDLFRRDCRPLHLGN
jgi:hypothetical protein